MIALLQRVTEAQVRVGGTTVGQIGPGLLVLLAVEPTDREIQAERLVARLLRYRVFEDDLGRMNRSLLDTGGGLLLVPQFTLAADTHKACDRASRRPRRRNSGAGCSSTRWRRPASSSDRAWRRGNSGRTCGYR